MGKFIDLSGQHFGFLTAKNRVKNVNLMKFTFNTIELLDWCDKIVKYNITKSK